MRDLEMGRTVRVLRRRRGWRQQDCAVRARVHRATWSRLERGQLDGMTLQSLRRCLAVLEVRLELAPRWRGTALDRLLDADHAALQSAWAGRLRRWGWLVWVEVSFNRYGDRGRIDLLAWQPASGVLVIGEVKSEIVDAQGLLGSLDLKHRVAPVVARSLGLRRPRVVVPLLLIRDSTTARRRLAALAPLFARFPRRGRAAVGSLRHPALLARDSHFSRDGHEPGAGMLILSDLSTAHGAHPIRVGGERVRLAARGGSVERRGPAPRGRREPG